MRSRGDRRCRRSTRNSARFRRLWLQGLAIAVVLACGVAILLTAFGMNTALTDTRDAYYERNRFADIFTDTRRAPLTICPTCSISRASTRPSRGCRVVAILDLPERDEVAMGQILSWPLDDDPLLNVPSCAPAPTPPPRTK
jgi:putative ABC transport system permease protein